VSTRDPYAEAGVDYTTLDAAKRRAVAAARATSSYPATRGAVVDDASRGEPATVVRVGDACYAFVLECLGTKSLIARDFEAMTGVDRYDTAGYDTVAAAVNDCCCVGALPLVVNAYFATGAASWYAGTRHASLVDGFARACGDCGAAWGGGESPTLSGLVVPDGIDLAAAVVGVVPAGVEPLLGGTLAAGDEIVLVSSCGLHQNGASLVRAVACRLELGLAEPLASGRLFGEAALDSGVIYVGLVEQLLARGVAVHYLSHITGHGLRKLMRADRELTYRIERLPEVPELLGFLAEKAGLSASEAYATLNMGAGFACYVAAGSGAQVVEAAEGLGLTALVAGSVEPGPRRVVLEPLGIEYAARDLQLR
jgi:phosphoribosylformylglycinamidine cyclo-ligase